MKNAKFLPLLFIVPLMMGAKLASPPYAWPHQYEDFEVSDFAMGEHIGDDYYNYSLNLKNTGEEYLVLSYFYFYNSNYDFSSSDTYFYNECLAPGKEVAVNGQMYGQYEGGEIIYYASSVFASEAASYSGVTFYEDRTIDLGSGNLYTYTYYMNDYNYDGDYYVSYLIHANVKGQEKYFFDTTDYFRIYSAEELVPDTDIEVLDISLVFGRNKRQIQTDNMWTTIWLVLLCAVGIPLVGGAVSGLVPLIIILCIKPWRKKDEN